MNKIKQRQEQYFGKTGVIKKEAFELKLPVDTLVRASEHHYKRYLSSIDTSRSLIKYFVRGATSQTSDEVKAYKFTQSFLILENKPQPWLGGECPVSEGVLVKVWFRIGGTHAINNSCYLWDWRCGIKDYNTDMSDIIAYQILEQVLTFERDKNGVIIGFSSELVG
jgi:hypothetical protein